MVNVVQKINDLGCTTEYIPGGCTGLVQPVDVGIGAPFKSYIKRQWLDWLHMQDIPADSAICPPTRVDIANWIVQAWNKVSKETVKNAFRHRPYHFVD